MNENRATLHKIISSYRAAACLAKQAGKVWLAAYGSDSDVRLENKAAVAAAAMMLRDQADQHAKAAVDLINAMRLTNGERMRMLPVVPARGVIAPVHRMGDRWSWQYDYCADNAFTLLDSFPA